ncbi:MAG: hypothetical protein P8X57_07340 [Cyclobacteriaceae bacterium]
MPRKTLYYIAGGLVIGIFYYWFNEYNSQSVWGLRIRVILMTACSILSFLLCYFDDGKPLQTALRISGGVLIAVLLRIIWDTVLIDSSMHNLLPFELGIAFALAFVTSLIGGLIGYAVRPKRVE